MSSRRGNCYVTCEALYHLLGGSLSGWTPHSVRHEGDVHWYLVKPNVVVATDGVFTMYDRDKLLDPTASQFEAVPPYHLGRGRGFLTKNPSKRARALMDKLLWQEK